MVNLYQYRIYQLFDKVYPVSSRCAFRCLRKCALYGAISKKTEKYYLHILLCCICIMPTVHGIYALVAWMHVWHRIHQVMSSWIQSHNTFQTMKSRYCTLFWSYLSWFSSFCEARMPYIQFLLMFHWYTCILHFNGLPAI